MVQLCGEGRGVRCEGSGTSAAVHEQATPCAWPAHCWVQEERRAAASVSGRVADPRALHGTAGKADELRRGWEEAALH